MVAAGDRPPFKLHTKPEDIAPFFFVEHHPYALSVLLKINDGFQADTFRKVGLHGSSKDWETLAMGFIEEWEGYPVSGSRLRLLLWFQS